MYANCRLQLDHIRIHLLHYNDMLHKEKCNLQSYVHIYTVQSHTDLLEAYSAHYTHHVRRSYTILTQ